MEEKDERILDDFHFIENGTFIPLISGWKQFGYFCKPFIEKGNVEVVRRLTKSFQELDLGKRENEELKELLEFVFRRDFENKTPEEMNLLFREARKKDKARIEKRKRKKRRNVEDVYYKDEQPIVQRMRSYINVESENNAIDAIESEERFLMIPKKNLMTRFSTKESLTPNHNEIIKDSNGQISIEIPETFPFSYEMEMVYFGFFNLLSSCGYGYSFVDNERGYFPGSNGKNIFFIPIKHLKDIYEAIGMKKKASRNYQGERAVKQAFEDLLLYKHPIEIRRRRITKDGDVFLERIVDSENLFHLLRYDTVASEEDFYPATLRRKSKGGWELEGKLKGLIILLNPRFFPKGIVRGLRELDSNLYKQIEKSRRKLSREDGKRYWKKEQAFLSFAYYLLAQGGKYKKSRGGNIYYEINRELEGLIRKLGLWERYKRNFNNALLVLERTLEIYKDIGFIHSYKVVHSRKGSKIKLRIRLNIKRFTHLKQPSERFLLEN